MISQSLQVFGISFETLPLGPLQVSSFLSNDNDGP